MTDNPSGLPDSPAAPESAATETPVRPGIPAQATDRTSAPASAPALAPSVAPSVTPNWSSAPGWGGVSPAPVPGWEWSHGWIPKPGIIPLRPLNVGDILSGSFALLRGYWRTILPFTAAIAATTQVASAFLSNAIQVPETSSPFSPSQDQAAQLRKNISSLVDMVPSVGALELISLIAGALSTAMIVLVVSKAVIGRSASLSEVWQSARPRLLPLLGLIGLVTLILGAVLAASVGPVLIGRASGASDGALAGLALLIIPGSAVTVWLYISMLLATPALMLERQSVRSALARSFRLVRGSWWRIFGIVLLVVILTGIVEGIISIPFAAGAFFSGGISSNASSTLTAQVLASIGGFIGSLLTLPVLTGSTAFLYLDQRIRREALDVDLANAAGVPPYTHA